MKKQIINTHHISYDPEVTVKLYKGEHWAITVLERRKKNMSKGFLQCLKAYIAKHEEHAVCADCGQGEWLCNDCLDIVKGGDDDDKTDNL